MNRGDRDQLQLLGIFHIVYGAIAALAGLVTLAYMCVLGLSEAVDSDGSAVAGGVVAVIGVFICALFVLKGIVLAASGYGLLHHKWRAFSQFAAILACLNVPMGTALCIFTFIVLDRASVRALYAGVPAPVAPAPYRPPVVTPRKAPDAPTTRPDPMRFRVA
jgi:hypothetical protein